MIGLGLGIEEEGGVGWQCGELEFVLLIGRPGQYFQQLEHKTSLKSSDRCRVAIVCRGLGAGYGPAHWTAIE